MADRTRWLHGFDCRPALHILGAPITGTPFCTMRLGLCQHIDQRAPSLCVHINENISSLLSGFLLSIWFDDIIIIIIIIIIMVTRRLLTMQIWRVALAGTSCRSLLQSYLHETLHLTLNRRCPQAAAYLSYVLDSVQRQLNPGCISATEAAPQ